MFRGAREPNREMSSSEPLWKKNSIPPFQSRLSKMWSWMGTFSVDHYFDIAQWNFIFSSTETFHHPSAFCELHLDIFIYDDVYIVVWLPRLGSCFWYCPYLPVSVCTLSLRQVLWVLRRTTLYDYWKAALFDDEADLRKGGRAIACVVWMCDTIRCPHQKF